MAIYEPVRPPVSRKLLWIILGVVLAAIILFLVIYFGFIYHSQPSSKTSHPTSVPPSASQQQRGSSPGKVQAPGSSSTQQSSTAHGGSPASSAPTAGQTGKLANTGPGDVALPVSIAVIAGTVLRYVYLQRATKNFENE